MPRRPPKSCSAERSKRGKETETLIVFASENGVSEGEAEAEVTEADMNAIDVRHEAQDLHLLDAEAQHLFIGAHPLVVKLIPTSRLVAVVAGQMTDDVGRLA